MDTVGDLSVEPLWILLATDHVYDLESVSHSNQPKVS